jgi:hypothetical protein
VRLQHLGALIRELVDTALLPLVLGFNFGTTGCQLVEDELLNLNALFMGQPDRDVMVDHCRFN